jgi:hypothetical protein
METTQAEKLEKRITKTPMTEEEKSIVNEVFQKIEERMVYLYGRWMDEREYEDFAEYEINMKATLYALNVPGVHFVKAMKRPFGFVFDYQWSKVIQISIKSSSYEWKRIS